MLKRKGKLSKMSPLTLDKYLEDTFRFFVIHYLKLDEDLYEYEENIYKDFIAIWCTKGLINTRRLLWGNNANTLIASINSITSREKLKDSNSLLLALVARKARAVLNSIDDVENYSKIYENLNIIFSLVVDK